MSTRTTTALDGRLFRGLKEIRRLFQIYITPGAGLPSGKVRVRPAIWQQDSKGFRLTTDGPQPSAIDWTLPRGLVACVESAKSILDSAGFIRSPLVPVLESFDPVETVQFDDYVVVFPKDSGLDPVYVLLNDRRDCPGVVKGLGQMVGSDWRTQAGSHDGAPIPTQIADQLRGQVFERFDAFQRAFWKTVAMTPALNAQFNIDNRALMLSGAAPLSEQTEGNHALRILHRVDVMQGADVYDLDNMKICV